MGFSLTGAIKSAASYVGDKVGAAEDAVDDAKSWVGGKIDDAVQGAEKGLDSARSDIRDFGEHHGGIVGKVLGETVSDGLGVAEGAGLAVYDMGKGVVQLADGAGKLLNPVEWATHGSENLQRLEHTGLALKTLSDLTNPVAWATNPNGNLNTAKALWNGVTGGYQDAAKQGDWSKFVGRGVVDIGSLLIGAGEANAAIKGAEGASAVAKIGEAGKAADGASALGKAGEGAKALEGTRAVEGASDAAKAAKGNDAAAASRAAADKAAASTGKGDDLGAILKKADTGTTIGGKRLLKFDKADDLNAAANAPVPNSVYQYGNFSWTTDTQGRVIRAEGKVDLAPAGRNDPTLQTRIGNEGRDTDVGFHLIADRFGGQTNRLNVVPGNGKPIGDGLPNLNNGAYKRFENQIADLRADGHQVEIRVSPEYDAGNASTRPDRFVAEFRTDGGRWVTNKFPNK